MGAGGGFGTGRAQLALRPDLAATEAYLLPKPELYVTWPAERFDADGRLLDDTVRAEVRSLVVALVAWVQRPRSG